MSIYNTKNNRVKIHNRKNLLEIRIPIKKNSLILFINIVASLLWTVALFTLVYFTLHIHYFWFKLGMVLSVMAWFSIGMAGASFFLWLFFGRERIIITPNFLITDKPLVFFYRRNFYPIQDISNFRIDKEVFKINRNKHWIDEDRTVLKFDTLQKFVTIGRGITKTEAQFIVLEIAKSGFIQKEQFALEQKI